MNMFVRRYVLPVALVLSMYSLRARASTISFTGDLRTDATVTACGSGCTLGATNSNGDYAQYAAVLRSFTVGSLSTVQAITFSYGGGINGAGATIAQSGFEPYLSLFNAAGDFLSSTYNGTTCPAGAKTNSALGGCYDVLLNAGTLGAGTYRIALSAFENLSFAENYGSGTLADGFTGLGNLYPGEDLHYAFDINLTSPTTTPPTVTPEPASLVLTGLGVVLFLTFQQQMIFRRNS